MQENWIEREYEELELNSFVEEEEDHFMGWEDKGSFIKAENQEILDGNLDWIQTVESIANDRTLTPNSKQKKKLANHIKLTFMKTGEAPDTTTEFYRIGKILGKGAFGKVNLAMHKLCEWLVAIKSINKSLLVDEK